MFCSGNNSEPHHQRRSAINVGDFFSSVGGTWAFEVVRVEGGALHEVEVRLVPTIDDSVSDVADRIITDVHYRDGGWYGTLKAGEVRLTHIPLSDKPWWKRVPSEPIPPDVEPLGEVSHLGDAAPSVVFDKIQKMQPGQHYEWHGFNFKFFDFALEGHRRHKRYLTNVPIGCDLCKGVRKDWYLESIAHARHMITISIQGTDRFEKDTAEAVVAMILAEPAEPEEVYYWVICAVQLAAYDDVINFLLRKDAVVEYKPAFGVLLQAVMGRYYRIHERKSLAVLDATDESAPYYEKFGYTEVTEKKYSMDLASRHMDMFWQRGKEGIDGLGEFVASVPEGASFRRRATLR